MTDDLYGFEPLEGEEDMEPCHMTGFIEYMTDRAEMLRDLRDDR